MRAAVVLLATPLLRAHAFPSLEKLAGDPVAVKRVLSEMRRDTSLMDNLSDLIAEQQRELDAWRRNGLPDIAGSLLNGTLSGVLGGIGGILGGGGNSGASVGDLKRFPEDGYPYQAPGPTDQRGPCPGLNTMANHGYLPRNGIATQEQIIRASGRLFNMGVDVAIVLTTVAIAFDGDIPSRTLSIGGANPRTNSLGDLGGSLGTETGLDGHSRFEADASATRCDFYLCGGDNHNMQPELFAQMLRRAQAHGNQFTIAALQEHFHARYADSKSRNPQFYFVPPSALVVIGAVYFHAGFFSNGTIGAGGDANIASIASFAGAHMAQNGTITYVPERIPPQGWYRRGVPMTLVEMLAGILAVYATPYPVAFGGNAGSTDAFVPGPGVLNADANGIGCFLYNALYADFFSEFQGILSGLGLILGDILGLLDPALNAFSPFGCAYNVPFDASPNAYGGAKAYLRNMSALPGAPVKQACQSPGPECVRDTNHYGGT